VTSADYQESEVESCKELNGKRKTVRGNGSEESRTQWNRLRRSRRLNGRSLKAKLASKLQQVKDTISGYGPGQSFLIDPSQDGTDYS
jgi:hypothetical protein